MKRLVILATMMAMQAAAQYVTPLVNTNSGAMKPAVFENRMNGKLSASHTNDATAHASLFGATVKTTQTITVGAVTLPLVGDLTFPGGGGTTNYVDMAGTVTGSQSNTIATAWQNPPSATNWTWTSDGREITLTGYTGPNDVVIPDVIDSLHVTKIGDYAFTSGDPDYIPMQITSVSGGNNVLEIGFGSFYGCSWLTNVSLNYVKTINFGAFILCSSLTNFNFENVDFIGNNAFASCTNLTSVTIKRSPIIQPGVFASCVSLRSVYFDSNVPPTTSPIYIDIPANQVTNYVTNPTATGWGATFGGMPVVRMPVTSTEVNAGTVISITSTTTGTNSAGFFQGDGSLLTGLPSGGSSAPLAWTPIETVASASVATARVTTAKSVYSFTASAANTLTNNLSVLTFNCTTNYEWQVWIDYTSTNALSTVWDSRIQWQGLASATPDLTVTGLYKFAFSTACGTRIAGKQIWPTVYEPQQVFCFVNQSETLNPTPGSRFLTAGNTNATFYVRMDQFDNAPVYLSFMMYGTVSNTASVTFGYLTYGVGLDQPNVSSTTIGPFYATYNRVGAYVPKCTAVGISTWASYTLLGTTVIRPNSNLAVSAIKVLGRKANELEIAAGTNKAAWASSYFR